MAVSLTVNGVVFSYPSVNDIGWGPQATAWATAVSQSTLQKSGGSFTLTADVDFGANYGLKSAYFKSRATNPAAAGSIRLGNLETISWRNAGNSADLPLTVDASGNLTFNGVAVAGSTGDLPGISTNGLVARTAAATYAARTVTAGTGISVTNGSGASGNPTIAIDSTVATLTGSQILTNKTINGADNTLTVRLANDVTGTLPIANGGTGQTAKTAAYNALSPLTTKGDLTTHNGTDSIRRAVGADGTVLSADSGQASGLNWISVLSNPMTTLGDIIYENASPAATRLAGNTSAEPAYLSQTGNGTISAAPVWKRSSQLGMIRLHTGNGYGSTNNKIRRFTTVVSNTITGLTYADSATLGASFTCTEAGTYCFSYGEGLNAISAVGMSLNSSQLTTTIVSITTADRLIYATTAGAGNFSPMTVTLQLAVGDVVRPHTDGTAESASPSRVHMTVSRIM